MEKTENTEIEEEMQETAVNGSENEENESGDSEDLSVEEKLLKQTEELKDKYLRLLADFENFKRNAAKDRQEYLKTAGKDLIISLLPVLDDFERGEKTIEEAKDIAAVKEGVKLIHKKLLETLERKGLKATESIGETFDPEIHEAITKIPAPSDKEKGKIVDEVERGYTLNEIIIRYAKVVVGE